MSLPWPEVHAHESVQENFEALDAFLVRWQTLLPQLNIGTGSPNGTVTASPPAAYLNRLGGAGTTLYVKESGVNTNTGWVGK